MGKYTYNASKTNMSKDQPLFLTKYVVTFILPPVLQAQYGTEILTEQVKKITGLNLDKMPEPVEQMYHGIKRRFGGTVADTAVDLGFDFEVNVTKEGKIYPLNVLRDWGRLIYNAQGVVLTKEEYSGQCVIEITNVKEEVLRRVEVPVFFPKTQIPDMDLDYSEDAIYSIEGIEFVAENASDKYVA